MRVRFLKLIVLDYIDNWVFAPASTVVSDTSTIDFSFVLDQTFANNDCWLFYGNQQAQNFQSNPLIDATCVPGSYDFTIQLKYVGTASSINKINGQITQFLNPFSVTQISPIFNYYSGCGTNVDSDNIEQTASPIDFTQGNIDTLKLTSNSNIVATSGNILTVSFQSGTSLPLQGFIVLTLPKRYTSVNNVEVPDFITGTLSVNKVSTFIQQITAISSTVQSITSTTTKIQVITLSYSLNLATGYNYVATSANPFTFTLGGFNNPITSVPVSGFYIQIYDYQTTRQLVDSSSSSFTLSGITIFGKLDSASITLNMPSSSFQANQIGIPNTSVNIVFKAAFYLEAGCFIKIKFPNDIKIDVNSLLSTYSNPGGIAISKTPNQPFKQKKPYQEGNPDSNYVIIEGCGNPQSYNNYQGSLTLNTVVSLGQMKTSDNFIIEIYKDEYQEFPIASSEQSLNPITLQLTPVNKININAASMKLAPISTDQTSANTDIRINFAIGTNLYSTSYIVIQLPPEIKSPSTTCTLLAQNSAVTNVASCRFDSNDLHKLYIENLFVQISKNEFWATSINPPQSLPLQFEINEVINPDSTRPAGSWTVTTYNVVNKVSYVVDTQLSTESYSASVGTLSAAASLSVSGDITTSEALQYFFSINLENNIPKTHGGGIMILTFPSEFNIKSTVTCAQNCLGISSVSKLTSTSTTKTQVQVSFKSTTEILTINNPFKLYLKGIQNPRTTKPTSEILISTYDDSSAKYIIDSGQGFSATMNQIGNIDDVTIQHASGANKVNGEQTKITITVKLVADFILAGDVFFITFPKQLSLNTTGSQFSCVGATCNPSGKSITAIAPSGTRTNSFSFTVLGVINPSNTRETDPFTNMYIKDKDNYDVVSYKKTTSVGLTLRSETPATIITKRMYQDNLGLGAQNVTYRIEFTTRNTISMTGSIVLLWPAQLTITDKCKVVVTSNVKQNVAPEFQVSNRKMIITNAFSTAKEGFFGSIQIEISQVGNPKDNRKMDSFAIYTYDDAKYSYPIDQLPEGSLIPQTDCDFPCATCLGSQRNYCVSCWSDGAASFLQPTTGQECLAACSSGYTSNGQKPKVCIKCDPTCKTCLDTGAANDKYKCVTCETQSPYFYPDKKKCLSRCEEGYYESSKFTCTQCKSPCYSCLGSPTVCTDCFKNSTLPFLHSQTCKSSCPSDTVGVNQICTTCDKSCATCINTTSTCLSCNLQTSKKYLFAFECRDSCPNNTVADPLTFICKGCKTGCKRCEAKNQTKCLECSSPFVLFDSQCLTDCPVGYKRNSDKSGCSPSSMQDLKLIYFPHVIASLLLMLLAIGGYFKDRKSVIITNMIVLIAPIEMLSFIVQLGLSLMFSTIIVTGATGLAIVIYILINCIFVMRFNKLVAKVDQDYIFWFGSHPKTSNFILTVSRLISFKMIRLNYSYLYGFDIFKVKFSEPNTMRALIRNYSLVQAIFSSLIIIAIDLIILMQEFNIMKLPFTLPKQGVINIGRTLTSTQITSGPQFKIDSQIKIVMIETLVISIIMLILTLWEFIRLRHFMSYDYNVLEQDSMVFASLAEEKNDKQLRRDMLKKIMQQVKGNQELFNENNLNVHKADDLIHAFGRRRCRSMNGFDNNLDDDPREIKSEPPQPKKDWGDDELNRFILSDNVYADSQPPNPLGKIGKTYVDADTWVTPDEFQKVLLRKGGDFLQLEDLEKSYRRKNRDKNKKRGRKNQYYTQIDAEDDQEAENMNESAYLSAGGGGNESKLGVIREEEEDKKSAKKKQVRISPPSQKAKAPNMEEQMKKIEEETASKKQSQKVEENKKIEKSEQFGKFCEDPLVQVPPDGNKRTFNENDILGEFDRDEKGSLIILQDQNGNFIDKLGRRVNERGYLIDPSSGNVIENHQQQTMFAKQDLDDRGEIPAPFCVEKYNFNPFKIRGEFNLDKNRNPLIGKNRNGDLVDKYGRLANKRGWLADKKGNIVDLMGVKKFDKRQINPDNGDLPRLLNYQGKKFDILDLCGAFDLNQHNGEIELKKNDQGQCFDKFGRLVNAKGYLIDFKGNVVDREGRKIFDKRYLSADGEIPKIFPFTKFNIEKITGDFEMDPLGNPILEKRSDGHLYDSQDKRVNSRGYLIDINGNVIDKKGKVMFIKEILEQDGEIPEVFRSGLLKADSASSLSRLMSEIERNQPEEIYNKKVIQAHSGGDTSIDSAMDDTPSNYNQANQRLHTNRKIGQIDEEDEHRRRRKTKKRKKKVVQEYTDPSDKDFQMAKAYGGIARGPPKRQIPKGIYARGINSPRSSLSQSKMLGQIANSVSGMRKQMHQQEETKSRLHQNQSQVLLNETNDPSMMAVPEHHLREERLKRQKIKEAKLKGRLKRKNGAIAGPGDPDFEKMFGKDIDEFLEDSDWDVESFDNISQYSRGTAKSAFLDGRIRGLESIYLQRIESGMKKGHKGGKGQVKPKFRVLQDRFVDDPSYLHENGADGVVNDNSSQKSKKRRPFNSQSAMGQYAMRNMSVTAQTQFMPAGIQGQQHQQL